MKICISGSLIPGSRLEPAINTVRSVTATVTCSVKVFRLAKQISHY